MAPRQLMSCHVAPVTGSAEGLPIRLEFGPAVESCRAATPYEATAQRLHLWPRSSPSHGCLPDCMLVVLEVSAAVRCSTAMGPEADDFQTPAGSSADPRYPRRSDRECPPLCACGYHAHLCCSLPSSQACWRCTQVNTRICRRGSQQTWRLSLKHEPARRTQEACLCR